MQEVVVCGGSPGGNAGDGAGWKKRRGGVDTVFLLCHPCLCFIQGKDTAYDTGSAGRVLDMRCQHRSNQAPVLFRSKTQAWWATAAAVGISSCSRWLPVGLIKTAQQTRGVVGCVVTHRGCIGFPVNPYMVQKVPLTLVLVCQQGGVVDGQQLLPYLFLHCYI